MSDDLNRLVERAGIERSYLSLMGPVVTAADAPLRATLEALGIPAADDRAVAESLASRAGGGPRPDAGAGRRRLLRARLAAGRPLLGDCLPDLQPALQAQLGDGRLRGPRPLRRDRGGCRRRLHRRQPAARPVHGRCAEVQPVLAVEPALPQSALHRAGQGAGCRHGARRNGRPGGGARGPVRRLRRRRPAQAEGADLPLPRLPRGRRSGRRAGLRRLCRHRRPAALPARFVRGPVAGDGRGRPCRQLARLAGGIPPPGQPRGHRLRRRPCRGDRLSFLAAMDRRAPACRDPGPRQGRRHAHRPLSRHGGGRRPRRLGHLVGPRIDGALGAHRCAARLLQRRRSGLGRGAAVAGGAQGARL